jgi:RAQPRD family integrative conjugative element protein
MINPIRLERAALQCLLLSVCAATFPAHADNNLEREKLARIAGEIKVIEDMTADAARSAQSSPTERVRFRYDWLQADLRQVRAGIEQHLDAPQQPRPVPPIKGDYRQ